VSGQGGWVGTGASYSGWGAGASSGATGGFGGSHGYGSVQWAEGGIATSPTFGVFGEAGPEAFIPLYDKPAAMRILPVVLDALGVRSFAKGGVVGAIRSDPVAMPKGDTFVFSPVVSGGNATENRKMLKDMFKEFKASLSRADYRAQKRRGS